jgi:hypothetical protein
LLSPPPPKSGPTDGDAVRTFTREANLADGTSIELGGIAWSETGPFVLLNGRVVGQGETVQRFQVTRIEPQQVELQRDGTTIVIRLK